MEKESAGDAGATGAGAETDPHFSFQHQALSSPTAFSVVPGMANSDWTDSVT